MSDKFLFVISEFKTIEKLEIRLAKKTEWYGSVECFKYCTELKRFDINYSKLTEHFFANVATFVPKLQYLKITTEKEFSDSFIAFFN